jgi:alcohol dehydrogenase class IV
MLASLQLPATILVGGGVRLELAAQAKHLGGRRTLLVTDPFLVDSGVAEEAVESLRGAGIETTVFSGVQPDPTVADVMNGLAALKSCGANLVVGLGGGSPMDAAKAIAILATNAPPISKYVGYHRITKPGLPLVLIPTTAGTGSEVTRVAVVTDTERDVKMMLLDRHLLPQVALVDFELSMTMPRGLTSHVGVDTLTHGLEAFVSRKASPLTDPIALSCLQLTTSSLETAFLEPSNREAREAMMIAACQGGMAFSNSSVALVHGMSRPIGAYFHVPHGLSNALLLPTVTRFSLPATESRYAAAARAIGIASEDNSDQVAGSFLVDYLDHLNRRLEIGTLRDFVRVDQSTFESKLETMAEDALASGSPQNNPRVPTAGEIVELYRQAW